MHENTHLINNQSVAIKKIVFLCNLTSNKEKIAQFLCIGSIAQMQQTKLELLGND